MGKDLITYYASPDGVSLFSFDTKQEREAFLKRTTNKSMKAITAKEAYRIAKKTGIDITFNMDERKVYNPLTLSLETKNKKTTDISYPKNKEQMAKLADKYIAAAKTLKQNSEKIEKILAQNDSITEEYNKVFNYLGEEAGGWLREIGKSFEINEAYNVFQKARNSRSRY